MARRVRRVSLGLGVVALLAGAASGAGPSVGAGDRFADLTAFLEGNPEFFPNGVGLAIVQDGAVIYRGEFHGFDAGRVEPIASSTKWVSGLAIAEAISRGEGGLSVETPISAWVPSFFDSVSGDGEPDKRGITLVEAFSHQSGFGPNDTYQQVHLAWWLTHGAAVEAIAGFALSGEPGEQIIYGGIGMHAAGLAAARAAGTDFTAFARDRLFDPLGMSSTDYDAFTGDGFVPTENPGVAGSIRTTIDDYLRFLTMLNGWGEFGGERVVSREAIEILLTDWAGPGVVIERSPYQNYELFVPGVGGFRTGFGCFVDPDRVSSSGEVRWATSAGLYGTNAWIDLERRITGVLFTFNDERWFLPPGDGGGSYNPSTRAFLQFVRPLVEAAVPVTCDADLSRDGVIGLDDLLRVLGAFGETDGGDTDGDGVTGLEDLLVVLGSFGGSC